MKKEAAVIIIIGVLICLYISNCNNNKTKYESWKDTIESFGDGTYQVMHQVTDEQKLKQLSNVKHKQCVITDIASYTVVDGTGYFVGKYHFFEVYCVLDIEKKLLRYYAEKKDNEEFMMVYLDNMLSDNQIELLKSYNSFTESEQNILKSLN